MTDATFTEEEYEYYYDELLPSQKDRCVWKMERKELRQKLSRLQSRAHNLNRDIEQLVSELDKEDEEWV